jgi:arginase
VSPDGGWELIGVPYTSMSEPGGISEAIRVLRERGLGEGLAAAGVEDGGDLELEPPSGVRGESALLNEDALVRLVGATRAAVEAARGRRRRPLLVGGDCPVLLGALAALREGDEPAGLVMVDGHEDAWPPRRSPTGEASDSEVAIALGRVAPLPRRLDRLVPLTDPTALAYLGPRDGAELAEAAIPSLRDEVAHFSDAADVAEALRAGRNPAADAVAALAARAFWLHVDLDVLSSGSLAAVDYRQPGGLGWEELERLCAYLFSHAQCTGASIAIYNPALDPTREEAAKVVEFAARLVVSGPRP